MSDHNLAITRAARSVLRPLGCMQKGRSRTWLDDQGWWVGLVEFQPSGFSKMSYLNVGACFLWTGKSHYSFDVGPDERGVGRPEYATVEEDPDFRQSATMLAEAAARDVCLLRGRLADVSTAATTLSAAVLSPLWGDLHRGIASGLKGDVDVADESFRRVCDYREDIEWARALSAHAAALRRSLGDAHVFGTLVLGSIAKSRACLGLPERPIVF